RRAVPGGRRRLADGRSRGEAEARARARGDRRLRCRAEEDPLHLHQGQEVVGMVFPMLAALTLATAPAPAKDIRVLEAAVAELTELASIQQRVLAASARLLGATYAADPLGEGPGHPDADPRLRLDAVDCQTYVETVLAMAASDSVDEVERRLDDLRYDG